MFSFSVFVETKPSIEVSSACKDAVDLAKLINRDVKFTFNGTEICAKPNSDWHDLVRGWHNAFNAGKEDA